MRRMPVLSFQAGPRPMTGSFFARSPSYRSFSSNNKASESRILMERAAELEKTRRFSEAKEIYRKIIFDVNPREEKAYRKYFDLIGVLSVFGYTHEVVDPLLSQYQRYILNKTPTEPNDSVNSPKKNVK